METQTAQPMQYQQNQHQQTQQNQHTLASNQPVQQNQDTEKNTDTPLEEKHQLAIDMRLLNYTYAVISQRLQKAGHKASEQWIREWFMKGGICYGKYETLRKARTEELQRDITAAKDQLQEATVDAIAIMRTSLRKALETGEISEQDYANAKDILDRGGYPKQTRSDANVKVESETMKEAYLTVRSVLERNILYDNPPQSQTQQKAEQQLTAKPQQHISVNPQQPVQTQPLTSQTNSIEQKQNIASSTQEQSTAITSELVKQIIYE